MHARRGDCSRGAAAIVGPARGLTPGTGMFVFRAQQGVPRTRATFVYYDGRGTLAGSADIERIQNADGHGREATTAW